MQRVHIVHVGEPAGDFNKILDIFKDKNSVIIVLYFVIVLYALL